MNLFSIFLFNQVHMSHEIFAKIDDNFVKLDIFHMHFNINYRVIYSLTYSLKLKIKCQNHQLMSNIRSMNRCCFFSLFTLISFLAGIPRKKSKANNGLACTAQQPKNTVAMLNELRQGLVYNLEGQTGPVHAPIFTMTVEVMCSLHSSSSNIHSKNSAQTIKLHDDG